MKSKAIKALAGKMFRESKDFAMDAMPEVSKKDLAMSALGGTAGLAIAHKKGYLEDNSLVDNMAILGAGLVGTGGLVKAAKFATRTGEFRTGVTQTMLEQMRQNLQEDAFHKIAVPFYGGGKAQQGFSVAVESIFAGGRALKRGFDYRASYAARQSGISERLARDLGTYEDMMATASENIAKIDTKGLTVGQAKKLVKKELKPVNDATKVLHNQIINDYSNALIYGTELKPELAKYASQFVRQVSLKDLYKNNRGLLTKSEIDEFIKVQGLDPKGDFKLLELSNKGLMQGGDVLRGIQFDARSANWFKEIYGGKLKPNEVFEKAKDIFGENAVKKLPGGKTQIIFSPTLKSNFDWGGYAGTIVYDPKNKDSITFMANDLRDLFGLTLGNKVLNITNAKRIKIPDILKERKIDLTPKSVSSGKKVDKKTLTGDKTNVDAMKLISSKMNMSKTNIEEMLGLGKNFQVSKENAKLTTEFVASRLAAGSGILGTGYALYDYNFGEED